MSVIKNIEKAKQAIMVKWDAGLEFYWSQPRKWSEPELFLMETGSFRAYFRIKADGTYTMEERWDEV